MSNHFQQLLEKIKTPEGMEQLASEYASQGIQPLTPEAIYGIAEKLPTLLAQQEQAQKAPTQAQVQPGAAAQYQNIPPQQGVN